MQFQQVAFLHVRNGLAYEAGLTPVDSSVKDTKVKCYQEYITRVSCSCMAENRLHPCPNTWSWKIGRNESTSKIINYSCENVPNGGFVSDVDCRPTDGPRVTINTLHELNEARLFSGLSRPLCRFFQKHIPTNIKLRLKFGYNTFAKFG
mgnify:CR=1 FL=1